ncbi:MAG TPA: acyltransferase [Gammaproteobacteria bacterium]|nr:acyltransferase [Gammaproteobacteria bacterium]
MHPYIIKWDVTTYYHGTPGSAGHCTGYLLNKATFFNKISQMKGGAILGVLAIHATAPAINPQYHIAESWIVALIAINQAARFCVPLFFFISGLTYGFFYEQQYKGCYACFIKKRSSKILIPYTFWCFFYLCVRLITGDLSIDDLSPLHLMVMYLTGSASGHLYFIPAIFQFYLLLPLFFLLVKKISAQKNSGIFWSLYLLAMLIALHVRMVTQQEASWLHIAGSSYWFFWWAPFSLIGLHMGKKLSQNTLLRIPPFFLSSIILLFFSLLFMQYFFAYQHVLLSSTPTRWQLDTMATFLRPPAFAYAVFCCLLSYWFIVHNKLDGSGEGKIISKNFPTNKLNFSTIQGSALLHRIGANSFGIYLLHPFVNKFLLKIGKLSGHDLNGTVASVFLLFFAGSLVSYLVIYCCRVLPGIRFVFGDIR